MKRIALIGMCVAVAALGFMGCEWSSSSGNESWSSSYDWVNFSGVYRGADNSLLVTDYTTKPPPNTASGASRFRIVSFTLFQQGQHLTITDNNGATYTGLIKKMHSASGYQNTDITQVGADEEGNDKSAKYTYQESPLPTAGDTIVASFECSGYSRAGLSVKIIGTLQGQVVLGISYATDTEAARVFDGRSMDGTWIELGGKTGNIHGLAASIPVAGG